MCKAFEQLKHEGELEGLMKGRMETAVRMLKAGFTMEQTVAISDLSLDEVQALAAQLNLNPNS